MPEGLTVAVTGPTGEIGIPFLRALEKEKRVAAVRGMARRPFDPASRGWSKTEYVRGDILDRAGLDRVFAGADVVVHLAFIIMGDDRDATRRINLEGSRNVFEAALAAGAERLVYTSSVAAYGFHPDNPVPLTEDLAPRGTDDFYYSAQKAELESTLAEVLAGSDLPAYVFRPCIVGGAESILLVKSMPYVQAGQALPPALRTLLAAIPKAAPVLPDPGVPMQLVHADDVAKALKAAVLGRGEPGVYNLAGDGEISIGDVGRALGYHTVPIPRPLVAATAELLGRMPLMPARAEWIHALRTPVVMDTGKAKRALRWRPAHDTRSTLRETVAGARSAGLIR